MLGRAYRGKKPVPGVMNKTEARYAHHLAMRHAAGDLLYWGFECIKLRLAANTFYTPDFVVIAADRSIMCYEVKATNRKTGKPVWTDDARVKIKAAAAGYWWIGFVATHEKLRQGVWWEEEIKP